MTTTLKLNGRTAIPTDTIKFIKPLTDADRERIAAKHGADVSARQIQVTFADKSQKTYPESIDDVKEQGVALVNTGNDKFVVAANIKEAQPFTKDDAAKAESKGYKINGTFRSRVEMTSGAVLSSAHPSQIMERRAKALGLGQGA